MKIQQNQKKSVKITCFLTRNVVYFRRWEMKIIKVTKDYYETEDEKVYFFEPLEKELSVRDTQKSVDANEKRIKELKDAKDLIDTW